jgi:hypothetical protein
MEKLPFRAKVLWRLFVTCKENKCPELEESTWRIKIRSLNLELSHVNTNIFVIFFLKIEIFDLQAVSIFATCTGESDTTTPFLQVLKHSS